MKIQVSYNGDFYIYITNQIHPYRQYFDIRFIDELPKFKTSVMRIDQNSDKYVFHSNN